MIYSNGHYGILMLHRYFMDYCTQIFYGLLHTDILWIIAQIYFMRFLEQNIKKL